MTIKEQLEKKNINTSQLFSTNKNDVSTNKESILFNAIKEENHKAIRHLIEFENININACDKDGWTPLMLASDKNDDKTVQLLLTYGAEIDLKNDDGETALMIAAYNNACDAGKILILNGADTTLTDKHNRTALDIAKENYGDTNKNYFLKEPINVEDLLSFFCNKYLSKKGYGSIIDLQDFNNIFYKQYSRKIEKQEKIKLEIKKRFQNDCELIGIDENKIKIFPTEEKIGNFINTFFLNNQSKITISFSELEDAILQKYRITLSEINEVFKNESSTFLEKHITLLKNKNNLIVLISENNETIRFTNSREIEQFVGNIIEKEDKISIFSYSKINKFFKKEFHNNLVKELLTHFIEKHNVKPSKEYFIEQLPEDFYIKRPFQTNDNNSCIFNRTDIPQTINKSQLSLILNKLEIINESLQEQDLIIRKTSNDPEKYILTFDIKPDNNSIPLEIRQKHSDLIINELKIQLKEFFNINTKTGISHPIKEIRALKNKYDILFNSEDIKSALAEIKIPDRIIKYNDNNLIILPDIKGEDIICPLCNELYSSKRIKTHYFEYHSNNILYPTNKGFYYCSNCGKNELILDDDRVEPAIVIAHITGRCKEPPFFENNITHKTTILSNDKVYKGSTYANNDSFFGNTGQMFRDHGPFGSMPYEDSYNDGDE